MKTEHRIPTTQFGYISVYVEAGEELATETINRLMADHARLSEAYTRSGEAIIGIQEKEMNPVVDKMLLGQTVEGGIEIYEKMNATQKYTVQTIKRALKRISAKDGE